MLAEQDSNSKPMIVNLSEFRSCHEQEAVRFRLLRATAGLRWIKAWLESQAMKHELLSPTLRSQQRVPGMAPRLFYFSERQRKTARSEAGVLSYTRGRSSSLSWNENT
jgi:hypothetical protein